MVGESWCGAIDGQQPDGSRSASEEVSRCRFRGKLPQIVQNGSSFQALTIPRSLAIFAESLFLTSPHRSEHNGQETIRQEIAGGAGLSQRPSQAAHKEVAEALTAQGIKVTGNLVANIKARVAKRREVVKTVVSQRGLGIPEIKAGLGC